MPVPIDHEDAILGPIRQAYEVVEDAQVAAVPGSDPARSRLALFVADACAIEVVAVVRRQHFGRIELELPGTDALRLEWKDADGPLRIADCRYERSLSM